MKFQQSYDMVVVGAGPAGLSAARTAARLGFTTLVIDRLSGPGELGHPCHAVVMSASDLVTVRPLFGGLFFPQIDLWIPEELITVSDAGRRALSPAGVELQTIFEGDGRATIIDKAGLLRLMADQAMSAGAEMRFGVEVTGLLYEGDRVVGVRTSDGDFEASLVVAAEGALGRLCEQAGLYQSSARNRSYTLSVNMEVAAPAVRTADLGQVVTLGQKTAFGRDGFASVMMPAPGLAYVTMTSQVDALTCAVIEPAPLYLSQYAGDPRVADLLDGARLLNTSSNMVQLQDAPASLVRNGFMAVGDVVSPTGQLGILPSIFLARQAALFAAEALDMGDVSAAALAGYDEFFRSKILPGLESEMRTMKALLAMTDQELDHLADLLNVFHLPIPFMGQRPRLEWETVDLLMRTLPMIQGDCALIQRVLGPESGQRLFPNGASPVEAPCQTPAVAR